MLEPTSLQTDISHAFLLCWKFVVLLIKKKEKHVSNWGSFATTDFFFFFFKIVCSLGNINYAIVGFLFFGALLQDIDQKAVATEHFCAVCWKMFVSF